VTGTELMPGLVGGNTERFSGKLKNWRGFLKPNTEAVPNRVVGYLVVFLLNKSTHHILGKGRLEMATNEEIIRDFIAAWSRLNTDELVAYFSEDGVYHNMPAGPVTGHDALRAFIVAFLADWNKTDWEILNLLVDGDIVVVERMDRTVAAGKPVDLPCCGVFEMKNGKIAVWRDYFDMTTYIKALS
jgi:limonene-1,2-epoxide hydrolase